MLSSLSLSLSLLNGIRGLLLRIRLGESLIWAVRPSRWIPLRAAVSSSLLEFLSRWATGGFFLTGRDVVPSLSQLFSGAVANELAEDDASLSLLPREGLVAGTCSVAASGARCVGLTSDVGVIRGR